jgi:hypothetical protein
MDVHPYDLKDFMAHVRSEHGITETWLATYTDEEPVEECIKVLVDHINSENHEKVFFSIAHVDSPGTDFTEITITHALMLVGSTFTEWDMSDEEIEQTWID